MLLSVRPSLCSVSIIVQTFQYAIDQRSFLGNCTQWVERYGQLCVKQRRAVHRR